MHSYTLKYTPCPCIRACILARSPSPSHSRIHPYTRNYIPRPPPRAALPFTPSPVTSAHVLWWPGRYDVRHDGTQPHQRVVVIIVDRTPPTVPTFSAAADAVAAAIINYFTVILAASSFSSFASSFCDIHAALGPDLGNPVIVMDALRLHLLGRRADGRLRDGSGAGRHVRHHRERHDRRLRHRHPNALGRVQHRPGVQVGLACTVPPGNDARLALHRSCLGLAGRVPVHETAWQGTRAWNGRQGTRAWNGTGGAYNNTKEVRLKCTVPFDHGTDLPPDTVQLVISTSRVCQRRLRTGWAP